MYEAVKRAGVDSKEYAKKVDHTDLSALERVELDLSIGFVDKGAEIVAKIRAKNTTKMLAFMNRLMITKGEGGEEILPTIWSDNFFTLLPGEEKILTARFAKVDLDGKEPVVIVDLN